MNRISRRNFLKAAGVGAAALGLAACGGSSSSTASSVASSTAASSAAAAADVTIKVAAIETGYGAEMWKKVAEAFTAQTGIKVELEEPPQAARPSAAAPTPAAFRKLRREIRFILCCLHHFVPFKHSRANRLCPKDCVFFCLQYKFFRFLAQEVCCFIFYRYCFLKNSSSKSAKNLLKVSA